MEQGDLFVPTEQGDLFIPDTKGAQSLLTDLLEKSKLYHSTKDYKDFLDFVIRLPHFAPFNAFLLQLQKPGLRFAASQSNWQDRYNRKIKEEARTLNIRQVLLLYRRVIGWCRRPSARSGLLSQFRLPAITLL